MAVVTESDVVLGDTVGTEVERQVTAAIRVDGIGPSRLAVQARLEVFDKVVGNGGQISVAVRGKNTSFHKKEGIDVVRSTDALEREGIMSIQAGICESL